MKKLMLEENELSKVSGGQERAQSAGTKQAYCSYCRVIRIFDVYSGGRAYCQVCGKPEQ